MLGGYVRTAASLKIWSVALCIGAHPDHTSWASGTVEWKFDNCASEEGFHGLLQRFTTLTLFDTKACGR